MLDVISNFIMSHPGLSGALAFVWPVLSAVVNILLYIHPVSVWVDDADKNPKLHAFANLMRAAGLDPVKVLQTVVDLILVKANPSGKQKTS